jgi:hypothetical protein
MEVPWQQAEPEPIINDGETAGRELHTLAIDARSRRRRLARGDNAGPMQFHGNIQRSEPQTPEDAHQEFGRFIRQ